MVNSNRRIAKNIGVSIISQIVSLAVSFVLNLIVPKFIVELQYSYWQSFALYSSYVGVLMFGILDGLVLRYSQYDYEELDKPRIRSQFRFVVLFGTIFGLILVFVSIFIDDINTQIIMVLIAIIGITRNVFGFGIYMLQITNRIKKYAIVVIIQRLSYGLLVLLALFLKMSDFYWICIFEILGDVLAIMLCIHYSRDLFIGSSLKANDAILELKNNISSGILLMAASWFSMLFVGMAKTVIQLRWENIVFGKVSFAFSITNLFLSFVSAISVVLFPTLKRMNLDELPLLYKKLRFIMSTLLIVTLLGYFPCSIVLQMWLPQYAVSLKYVALLLPSMIFTSKVSVLTNNYLKAYRLENKLLVISLITLTFSIVSYIAGAFLFNSLELILIFVDISLFARYIALELCLKSQIGNSFVTEDIIEGCVSFAFIVIAYNTSWHIGLLLFAIVLALYLFMNRNAISSNFLNKIRSKHGEA